MGGEGGPVRAFLLNLIVLSLATYPFVDMRLEVAAIRVPYSTILLPVLAFACLLRLVFRRFRPAYPPVLLLAIAGLYLSMLVPVSLGAAPDWEWMVRYGIFFLIPLFLPLAIESLSSLRLTIVALLSVGLFLAIYGYCLFFDKRLGYYDLHYTESTRNGDAALMSAFLMLALAYSFWGQGRKGRVPASLILTVLFGSAVLLSFSRGVWLGVGAGLLSLAYFRCRQTFFVRHPKRKLAALGVLFGVFIFAIPQESWLQLSRRFTSIAGLSGHPEVSNQERRELYASCAAIVAWEGWAGTGVRNFGNVLRKRLPHFRLQHAHNGYLNMWAEQGVMGLIAYLVVTFYPIRILARSLLERSWTPQTWVFSGLLSIAITWTISSLFDTLYFGFYYWLVYGIITSAALLCSQAPAAGPPFRGKGARNSADGLFTVRCLP